jgi:plastocyanin
MRKAILTVAALGLAASPVLVSTPAFAAGGDTVTIKNFSYSTPVSVAPGATITVVNNDPESHTVTADSGGGFNDLAMAGSTTTFKAPSQPGRYAFHCNFHGNMHGVLVVTQTASSNSSSAGSPSSGGSASGSSSSGGSASSGGASAGGSSGSQMQAMPSGGVDTGGGSTAGLQDEGLLLAGATSVTAGLGGLVLGLRRRTNGSKA